MTRKIAGLIIFLAVCAPLKAQQSLLVPQNDIPVYQNGNLKSGAWGGGINSAQFNRIDLDLDGQDELVILDRNAEQISVFSNVNGQFISNPDLIHLLPEINRNWIILYDYDCDGDQDLFNYGISGIVVFKNVLNTPEGGWVKVADPLFTQGFSGKVNLLVNAADLPVIEDVDGDGDVDILSYNFILGEDILFHQNMSVEKTGNCGELDFEITNRKWGAFKECACHAYAFGDQTCADVPNGRVAHTGGKALIAYDFDDDNDKDIFISHSDCNDQIYLENVGDQMSPLFTDYTFPFPDEEEAISIPIFPTVKFMDMNGDDVNELLAAPNIDFNFEFTSDFAHSLWQYENQGTLEVPDYRRIKKDFLQEDVIDLGELSFPVFFDIDSDGDQDLLVAANGKNIDQLYYAYVALFENTGNKFTPEFTLIDEDYLQLSSLKLHAPSIRLTDLNNDGLADFFYSGYDWGDGKVKSFIFFNQAKKNEPSVFSADDMQQIVLPTRILDVPEFADVTRDGLKDLIVGERNGSLTLYKNTGNFEFELLENEYLGIRRDFAGYKVNVHPYATDYNNDGSLDLIVADTKDLTVYFSFIDNSIPKTRELKMYNQTSESEDSISMQKFNSIASTDLYRTGFQSLILGGSGGGMRFYRQKFEVDNPEVIGNKLIIYPNPVFSGEELTIESLQKGVMTIYNLTGQKIRKINIAEKSVIYLDTSALVSGVYIIEFLSNSGVQTSTKLIINR